MRPTPPIAPLENLTHPTPALANVHRLKSIAVIGGFLDGVRLDLAEGLNCIIGARGTGKTTALELLRYAIDALPSRESQPTERRRIEALVEKNLAGGRVELRVETKDGLPYTITRAWGEEPIVLAADGSPTAICLAHSGIFKADIFSQNEVERIAEEANSQLALIDTFEAEAIAQLQAELRQVRSLLSANANRIVPLRDKLAALRDELGTLPSVEERLKRYTSAGGEDVSEIDRAHALKAQRDRQRRAVDRAGEILQTSARGVQGLIGQITQQTSALTGQDVTQGPNGPMLRAIVDELHDCGRQVDRLLEQARARIAGSQEELARRGAALSTVHREQELAFRRVIEQHQQAQGEAAERAQLERLRNDLAAKARLYDETSDELKTLEEERQQLLARLSRLREERFAIRSDVVRRINEALAPAIRAPRRPFSSSRNTLMNSRRPSLPSSFSSRRRNTPKPSGRFHSSNGLPKSNPPGFRSSNAR